MKKQLKLAALAAAVLATGAANAFTSAAGSGNGSLFLVAYNTSTLGWYIRDTGILMNDFLPSSVPAALSGDNPNPGNKSPEAGLNLTLGAADSTFSTWVGGAATSLIKWGFAGLDSLNANPNGVARAIISSSQAASVFNPTNGQMTTFTGNNPGWNGLTGTGNSNVPNGGSLSFASGASAAALVSFGGLGNANFTTLGNSANLYYYTRTGQTTGTSQIANETQYANSLFNATLTLNGDGSIVYDLQPAVSQVPLPGAVWLMGAGLAAIGGMVRRRKAAAEA